MLDIAFLWISLEDLSDSGTLAEGKLALTWLLIDEDEVLPGAYTRPYGTSNDNWIIVKTLTQERVEVLKAALDAIASAKRRRKLRTRITVGPEGAPWKWVSGGIS